MKVALNNYFRNIISEIVFLQNIQNKLKMECIFKKDTFSYQIRDLQINLLKLKATILNELVFKNEKIKHLLNSRE